MKIQDFVVLDLETTGLSVKEDQILEIGAESMAKTVRGEVWGNRVLYDLIPPKFCPQFYVQVPREGVPKALEAFVIVPVPGAGLKYRGIRFPLHAEEMIF